MLEPLENYSIAKFHNDDLIADYGGFNYPSSLGAMIPKVFSITGILIITFLRKRVKMLSCYRQEIFVLSI